MVSEGKVDGVPLPRGSKAVSLTGALRGMEDSASGRDGAREVRYVVHELEIQRTELEAQNQQLRESSGLVEESQARYADLYDFAPVAYLTLDASGKIQEANLTAAALFGVERGKLMGHPLSLLVTPESRATLLGHLSSCLHQTIRVSDEVAIQRRRTSAIATQITSTPLLAGDGRVVGCKTTLTDISALKHTQEVLRFLAEASTILASSFDYPQTVAETIRRAVPLLADFAVIDLFDRGHELQRIEVAAGDPQLRRLVGLARKTSAPLGRRSPVGWMLEMRQPLLIADCTPETFDGNGNGFVHEAFVAGARPRSILYVPVMSHGILLGVLTLLDVEPPRRFSEADVGSATDLANRVALAVENAGLYEDATRAIRAREEVLSFVSHDLKNPLMGILLSTELLLNRAPAEERRRGWKQLDRIRRGVQQMRHMVEDLLDLSSLDAGRLSMSLADHAIDDVFGSALELLEPIARDKAILLRAELPDARTRLRCDRERLVQVLYNVVGNAIKFTPNKGSVVVSTRRSEEQLVISVRDTGPGIPPELLPRLFQRYAQDERTARRGRGLGLFISRAIVEAHGGRIWVDSRPGAGATFSFTLPFA